MMIVYDYEPSSRNDPIVTQVQTMIDITVKEVKPAVAALLNVFPYRQYFFIHCASVIEKQHTMQLNTSPVGFQVGG